MSFRVDAVEIMNRFTEYSPSRGETPLPLPIPGFWFKRICALADRVAKAENQNDDLNAQVAALQAALAAANEDAERLASSLENDAYPFPIRRSIDEKDAALRAHRARVGGAS